MCVCTCMGRSILDIITDRRLQWLVHVGRMSAERLPIAFRRVEEEKAMPWDQEEVERSGVT